MAGVASAHMDGIVGAGLEETWDMPTPPEYLTSPDKTPSSKANGSKRVALARDSKRAEDSDPDLESLLADMRKELEAGTTELLHKRQADTASMLKEHASEQDSRAVAALSKFSKALAGKWEQRHAAVSSRIFQVDERVQDLQH